MYYVYLIKSRNSDWRYVGYSADLKKRIVEHQKGLSPATKPYKPLELIFYEAFKSRKDAKRREKYFKTNKGKRTLNLILKESRM
jgi:putative endonuclease